MGVGSGGGDSNPGGLILILQEAGPSPQEPQCGTEHTHVSSTSKVLTKWFTLLWGT